MRTTRSRTPDPIAIYAGQRIRTRRLFKGMTQTQLGDEIGVTFQQVQKYENGADRISITRLSDIAAALDAAPGTFFPLRNGHDGEQPLLIDRADAIEVLHALNLVRGKRRTMLVEMVKAFAQAK
jgi:transcriptional regulator with XRE-family HTH domain